MHVTPNVEVTGVPALSECPDSTAGSWVGCHDRQRDACRLDRLLLVGFGIHGFHDCTHSARKFFGGAEGRHSPTVRRLQPATVRREVHLPDVRGLLEAVGRAPDKKSLDWRTATTTLTRHSALLNEPNV